MASLSDLDCIRHERIALILRHFAHPAARTGGNALRLRLDNCAC
jgi:hypothetical protein